MYLIDKKNARNKLCHTLVYIPIHNLHIQNAKTSLLLEILLSTSTQQVHLWIFFHSDTYCQSCGSQSTKLPRSQKAPGKQGLCQ